MKVKDLFLLLEDMDPDDEILLATEDGIGYLTVHSLQPVKKDSELPAVIIIPGLLYETIEYALKDQDNHGN